MESAKQRALSRILPLHGIAFFRFDHRGCGTSQGNFLTQTSIEKRSHDFVRAVETVLASGLTTPETGLFGSSLGGATCIVSVETLRSRGIDVRGIVVCSAPVRSRTISNIPAAPTENRGALPLSFFEKNLVFDILNHAQAISHILVFHGDKDEVVPVQNAHDLYKSAREPKKLVIHENGDHQMSDRADQKDFEEKTLRWFKECF